MKTVELNEIKICFREGGDDWAVINEVFHEDAYRIKTIPVESVVIDLGAHIGTFTLRCAAERGCKVYAYEPCTETFKVLKRNIELNGLDARVQTFKQAIGGLCQARKFCFYPGVYQSARLKEFLGFEGLEERWGKEMKREMVETVTLKRVFEDNNVQECEGLKMDIEGAEKEVLVDKWAGYLKRARRIIVEWHNYDGHIYADYLEQLGFSVLLTGTGMPTPPYDPTFQRGMLYAEVE